MPKFDPNKDKVLWEDKVGDLQISVRSYNGGSPKFQIGPRMVNTKTGEQPRKAGRLSVDEFYHIYDNGEKILNLLEGTPDGSKGT